MIRFYTDTSVFGGVFDEEFEIPSRIFFDLVRQGSFGLVISDIVRREMEGAPDAVRALLDEMLAFAEIAPITTDALTLRRAYLGANILTPKWLDDALHVALATVSECDAINSWNFKHIVHYQKIPLYNAVNTLQGCRNILIHSPQEVIYDGTTDENI